MVPQKEGGGLSIPLINLIVCPNMLEANMGGRSSINKLTYPTLALVVLLVLVRGGRVSGQ